jgi:hypothetical protein
VERRNGDGRVAAKRILASRHQMRRHVGDRHDKVQVFLLDQILHKAIESLWRARG